MAQNDKIQLFEDKRIRTAWDEKKEEWYFSVVDVVAVLTDQPDQRHAAKYWSVLKTRLKKEGSELTTNCSQLKMRSADGKRYNTDVADTEQLLRIVQSISENIAVAREGGEAAGIARKAVEERTGVPVITSKNAAQLNQVVTDLLEGAAADMSEMPEEK